LLECGWLSAYIRWFHGVVPKRSKATEWGCLSMESLRAELQHDVIGALESPDPARRFRGKVPLGQPQQSDGWLV
jgi:hypothetical protein